MTAKCKYSPKFWPLVKQMQLQGNNLFKQFMIDNFIDGNEVYENIIRGANYSPANNIINEVKPVDKTVTKVVEEDPQGSVETMYVGNPSGYRNMIRNFKKEIISRSVFNKDLKGKDGKLGVFIDAERTHNGRTVLNNGILEYKLSLINKLREKIGLPIIESVENDVDFANLYNETLDGYAVYRSGLVEEDSAIKDSYIILKRFDSLLKSVAPFIEIRPEYKNSGIEAIDKYVYKGPNVQHFTGFTSSEWADALEQSSDLAKLILDYLPETNSDGEPTESVIGIEGFTSVMGSLQTELRVPLLEIMKSHSEDLYKGANIPMAEILSDYITALEQHATGAAAIEGSHLTYMLGKLRGIRDYIYSAGMNKDVQNMFTAMFFKNIPIKYRSYQVDQGRLKGRNLSEQYVNNQLMRIYDTIQAAAYVLEHDESKFERIKSAYNIEITRNEIKLFTSEDGGVKTEVVLQYSFKNGSYSIKQFGYINEQTARDFIYDVTGLIVPDEFMDLLHNLQPNDTRTLFEIFKEVIAIPLIHASNKHNKTGSSLSTTKSGLVTNLHNYKAALVPIANIQSIIYGSETASVIKNPAGNNIPKYQLISLAQNYHAMLHEYEDDPGIFAGNLLFANRDAHLVDAPLVRSDVAMRGKIKTPSQLTINEVLQLAILEDFYGSVDSGTIYLQNTTFADKNTHYLIPFNIGNELNDGRNLQTIIKDALKSGDTSTLFDIIFEVRSAKMQLVAANLLADYNKVLGTNFTTLEEVDQYFVDNKIKLSDLKSMFKSHVGIDGNPDPVTFYEEIHGYVFKGDSKKIARVNETIMHYNNVFNDPELMKARLEKEKRFFIKNLIDNGFKLNKYDSAKAWDLAKQYPTWHSNTSGNITLVKVKGPDGKRVVINSTNSDLLTDPNYTIELHPVFDTYFMTDVLLSNEYTSLMTGEVWAHPNKNKEGFGTDDYFEFSEANRLIAQNKRAVIYGATVHPFLQGMKYGVAETINISVISDIPGTVWNMIGEENDGLDTMDGSGFSSPYQSRFENNSLVDAAVGHDKKTIMHDNDPRYGRPTLLKWAVFELTNDRRRKSQGSDVSFERLFKKMHSAQIDGTQIDLNKYYQDWVQKHNGTLLQIKDPNTGNVRTLTGFTYVSPGVWQETGTDRVITINSIYDLDQAFGGAFGQIDVNGNLEYCDANIDIVSTIIGDYKLKDKMIAYAINKSAIKVGAGNVNSSDAFYDESPLQTITMSTKFGGVQMNADHDLDLSHVTEMTQMLSALVQNGYTSQFVNEIYADIGGVVAEALSDFDQNIKSDDPDIDKLYTLLGKALIDSFMGKDKDTLGLAQAFVMKAEESLAKSSLKFKLPFSAATVNGAFIATVTSMLNKKGIRRKYDGLAGVLCPSHDAIQYYKVGSTTMTYDELYKITNPARVGLWANASNEDFINMRSVSDVFGYKEMNPFIQPINQNDIDFEDTILVGDPGADIDTFKLVKIDSWTKYDEIKHLTQGKVFYNWTIKPKNLKQSNLTFELYDDSDVLGKFSEYQLDSVRASQYLVKYKEALKKGKDVPLGYMLLIGSRNYTIIGEDGREKLISAKDVPVKNWLLYIDDWIDQENERTKTTLRAIDLGKSFEFRGRMVKAQNVELQPAEIIMGRRNVQALGLREGDSIHDIQERGWEFFYDRIQENYTGVAINSDYYDAVLYDGSGNKILVMVASQENAEERLSDSGAVRDDSFVIVDGEVYVDEQHLTSSEGKSFYSVTDNEGNRQRLVVVHDVERFNELKNNNKYPLVRYNYGRDIRQSLLIQHYDAFTNGELVNIAGIDVDGSEDFNQLFTVEQLLEIEEERFNKRVEDLAVERFNAFNESLNFVCARIPTQGMQSFMPMRVVAFTDSKINDVYVAKANTWLEGSDFDIDKLYILGYSLDSSGRFQTTSNLQQYLTPKEVVRLPQPDGRTFRDSREGIPVSIIEMQQILMKFGKGLPITGVVSSLEPLIKILESSESGIVFEEPNWLVQQPFDRYEYEKARRDVIWILNKHSKTRINNFGKEGALKNRVVSGILDVVNNPQNQIALHTPIAMEEPQKAAAMSKAGEEAKHACADNPATKYLMQAQNMVGKEVIGLTAVSLKVFFAVSTYLNNQISTINNNVLDEGVVNILEKCIVLDPRVNKGGVEKLTSEDYMVYANLNFHDLIERYAIRTRFLSADMWRPWMVTPKGQLIDLHKELVELQKKSDRINAADALSALLSAATDNAKELILAKINASSKFVDIYTYLLSIGTPFGDIAKIMTSDIFNKVVKLTETNIFDEDTDSFTLESALDFYLNRKPLKFVDRQCLRHLCDPEHNDDNWMDKLNDNEFIEKLLLEGYNKQIKEIASVEDVDWDYDEDGYFDSYDGTDYDDEGEGVITRNFNSEPITSTEWRKIVKFLEYVRERNIELNKFTPEQKQEQRGYLEIIADKIVPAMKEMELLGGMLGINQGMRTDNYDKFAYIQRIERFINDRFEAAKITTPFKLMQFLSDPVYRQDMIEAYETVKTTYNILDVITKVPHFASMFDLLYMDNYLITEFSVKTKLERDFSSQLKTPKIKSINQREFKEVSSYVNDLLIYNWITSMTEPLTITVPVGEIYYDEANVPQSNNGQIDKLPLNSTHGMATFKHIVENYIIPMLKSDPKFKDNYFIRSLSKSIMEDKRTGEVREFYRLPLQMMSIDASPKTMMIYENILQAFDELSNTTIPEFGWKVGDLFYLYNLLVHKDSFGQNSMTRLFENLVGSKNSTFLIDSYYNFISKLDNTDLKDQLEYEIDDLKFRIKTRVPGTKISPSKTYTTKHISDFTLDLPCLTGKGAHQIQGTVEKINDKQNYYYQIKRDSRAVIRELSEHLENVYGHSFHIVSSRSVKDMFGDDPSCWGAKAFIANGEVYVNVDYASVTDPLHEFAHILMAGLKWNSEYADIYYNAVSAISDHPDFDRYAAMYPNKHGSDLQEEVFIKILQNYLDNTIANWDDNVTLEELNDGLFDAINRILGINVSGESLFNLGATDLETLLNVFKSALFDHRYNDIIDLNWVVTNQKTATLKNNYVEEEKLKQECN